MKRMARSYRHPLTHPRYIKLTDANSMINSARACAENGLPRVQYACLTLVPQGSYWSSSSERHKNRRPQVIKMHTYCGVRLGRKPSYLQLTEAAMSPSRRHICMQANVRVGEQHSLGRRTSTRQPVRPEAILPDLRA